MTGPALPKKKKEASKNWGGKEGKGKQEKITSCVTDNGSGGTRVTKGNVGLCVGLGAHRGKKICTRVRSN